VDDAAIDRRWREIYAANRAVVGPDPDLIRPGERLRLPR
jgi:nucleoid-associated protein YgaU